VAKTTKSAIKLTSNVFWIEGDDLPGIDYTGSIVLPADALEPAFLVYQNYRMIMRWNRSHLFSISLGHLADRIAGKPPLVNNSQE